MSPQYLTVATATVDLFRPMVNELVLVQRLLSIELCAPTGVHCFFCYHPLLLVCDFNRRCTLQLKNSKLSNFILAIVIYLSFVSYLCFMLYPIKSPLLFLNNSVKTTADFSNISP